jgi:hypothetical protein
MYKKYKSVFQSFKENIHLSHDPISLAEALLKY